MPYTRITSLSHKPSFLCLLTLVLHIALFALYFIYVFTPIVRGYISHNPIIYVLISLHILLIIFLIYNYVWLLTSDPVDSIVQDPSIADSIQQQKLTSCNVCGIRLLGSHHCRQCGRCTGQFDHHCQYLNNCIGGQNYQVFLRLLCIICLIHGSTIGQSVWVFVVAQRDDNVKKQILESYWVIIGIICLSGLLLIVISVLLVFHCYLSCCLGFTTLDYLFRGTQYPVKKGKQQDVNKYEEGTGIQLKENKRMNMEKTMVKESTGVRESIQLKEKDIESERRLE